MSSRDTPPADPGPRQAVVIIHGIGEQRPMATLRSFVSALLDGPGDGPGDRPGDRYHSKPDMISESYELRRIKLRRAEPDRDLPKGLNLDWPETDFYEYYWAHQMYGTKASHVVRWLFATMWRSRRFIFIRPAANDYPRLQCLAILAWLMVAVAALFGAIAAVLWLGRDGLHLPTSAAGVVAIVLGLGYGVLRHAPQCALGAVLDFVGDAARYFDVNPKNVARRYDILRGGIALLRKLHEDRDVQGDSVMYRYGRVVLVGHSLGSVIAYDILRHYWAEVNGWTPVNPVGDEITEVEGFVAPKQSAPPPEAADGYRRAQSALWKAISDRVPAGVRLSLRALWRRQESFEPWRAPAPVNERAAREEPPGNWQPARWLVSDLVTVGSPLAYAPVLLATGIADLDKKLGLRELPTCPPDRSRHVNPGHYTVLLSTEANRFDDYHILHHGACFASTRWTNLWYPNDPVGGPLRPAFGGGILDIPLPDTFWPLQSHIKYWPTPSIADQEAQRQAKSTQTLAEILRSGNESAAQSESFAPQARARASSTISPISCV